MSSGISLRQSLLVALLVFLAVLTLLPFCMTLLISQKSNAELFSAFWSLPREFRPDYYAEAYRFVSGYILNSLIVGSIAVCGTLVLSSLGGYVFARLEFGGKKLLFTMLLALMMVPGILTLVPAFKWYNQFPFVGGNNWLGYGGKGFLDSRWVLILPVLTGGQVLGIFLCRTFIEQIPASLFEAARIDGASELANYRFIALPLLLPTLAALAIITFVGVYNDYIWPLITISDNRLQVFSVGVTRFGMEGNLEYGPVMAGYLVGSLPLVVLFAVGMRYYVEGLTRGGIKA